MLIGLDEFLLCQCHLSHFSGKGANNKHETVATHLLFMPVLTSLLKSRRTFHCDVNETYEKCAKSDAPIIVTEMCNKVLLLLAVTLFNQIKLKRALSSLNYEDKSKDLHDVRIVQGCWVAEKGL